MNDIKSLPDHIMIKFFGNLSPKMIKTCSLICKSWDEIIANSTELMGKFLLNLNKPDESIRAAKEIRRKHQSILVKNFEQDSLDVINTHKLHLKSISIGKCRFKVSTLIETLNSLTALKDFDARYAVITDDISKTVDFKKIRINIKELQCDVEIIHLLDCCTVRKLNLISKDFENYNRKVLMDFLSHQKDLQELDLSDELLDDLLTSNAIFKLKLSLKSLKVYNEECFLHYEKLIQFLRQQKNSLTSLEIDFWTDPQFNIELINTFAIKNLRNLKHLKIGHITLDRQDSKMSFADLTPEKHTAKNIESLKFYTRYNLNGAKRFFELLPNLKKLKFETCKNTDGDDQLLHHISLTNTKLEVLKCSWMDGEDLRDVYFPNLKEFSVVFEWFDLDLLSSFINRHSATLEKLTLPDVAYIPKSAIIEIMNCKHLKSLVTVGKYNKSKKKKFTFPDDKAIWDDIVNSLSEEDDDDVFYPKSRASTKLLNLTRLLASTGT